jgi:HK97 gp10 family phage protein
MIKTLEWHQREFMAFVQQEMVRRTRNAAMFVQEQMVKSISRSQPTFRAASGRVTGLSPSAPGEPPKMVSRDLRNSIRHKVISTREGVIGIVGVFDPTISKQARFLEFGTSKMAARPFMKRAVFNHTRQIFRFLGEA